MSRHNHHKQSVSSLKKKLDTFISKYHRMQLVRGSLAMIGIFLVAYISVALIEYYGWFGSAVRAILFFALLTLALFVTSRFIVLPLLQLFKISKGTLSYEKASAIIGNYFPEVRDKLLNSLQLEEMSEGNEQNELLLAAIDQKSREISNVPFLNAIDWQEVKKVGKYSIFPITLFLVILIFKSGIFTESTQRILQFQKHFAKPAPFEFKVLDRNPEVYKNQDYTILLETPGSIIPEEMYILSGGNTLKMETVSKGRFAFTFRNVQASRNFVFNSGEFSSNEFHLKVIPKPVILNFKVSLNYPAYLNKKNETLENVGDFTIPAGTQVTWNFVTRDADELTLLVDSSTIASTKTKDNGFEINTKFKHSSSYQIRILNKETQGNDSMNFVATIIADEFPTIYAEQQKDSNLVFTNYIFGDASDDHGISRLTFFYRTAKKGNEFSKIELPVTGSFKQNFFLPINLKDLGIEQNEELEYFVQVWDNDRVAGPKSSKTSLQTLKRDSDKELIKQIDEQGKALMSDMQNAMQKVESLQETIKSLEKELKQKSTMTWEDKQKIEKLLEEQRQLQKELEKIKQENQQRNEFENQFKDKNEELLKKQEQIQKLFDELFDEKTKEMFKKLEEMMKKQDMEKVQDQLDKLNKDNKDLEKMLDNTLEQFKKLELEKKINETVDKLEELAQKQEELSKETENADKDQKEELLKKQEELNKEFEDLKKDLNEIEQKNNNMETPMELEDTKETTEEIGSEMENAEENISKNKKKNASQNQKSAAEKMQQMAKKMQEKLEESNEEQEEEDYNTLRQLLKNLILLSSMQEEIMQEFSNIKDYNPRYIELAKKQKELRQSSLMIEDSLNALAKRQPMINSFVTKELGSLVYNMEGAIAELSERNTRGATVKQQYAMTHTNNLAVFLTEVLKQMQQQMNDKKDKDSEPQEGEPNAKCNKPGKGDMSKSKPKPSTQGMQQLQERLNKMMKEMQEGKMNGKSPSSQEFAKIAAQQEALRKELEKVEKELREQGEGGSDLAKELAETRKMMEDIENKLYNKQLDTELFNRVEEISHRLFEHEKAEREQGEDEKRKGERASEKDRPLPPSIEKYLKEKAKELEFYRTLPPEISPYYKERVKEYYKNLQL